MRKSWMTSCAFAVLAACHAHARVGPVHAGGGVDPVVEYQVKSLEPTIAFYQQLGFTLVTRNGPTAQLARDGLTLIVDAPGATAPNRIVLYVDDIRETYDRLARAGVNVRGSIEHGPGPRGTQGTLIVLHDPDGNAVELHERPKAASR